VSGTDQMGTCKPVQDQDFANGPPVTYEEMAIIDY
jgi:hypothetical protein